MGSESLATSGIVSEADLEHELKFVRSATAGGPAGIFGPDSVIWSVDREAAVFLGAGRALLLQLAHPWVAAAITQHSRSLADPIGRFHRTFSIVFTMVFGTTGQALAAARRLHRRHTAISGTLREDVGAFAAGSAYCANDVAALRWVHATLIDTALLSYQLVNPPLSGEDRDRYDEEMRLFAALFGIPKSALPQSWTDFAQYRDGMFGSDTLAVSSAARSIAAELFGGAGTRLRAPFWYRALTASLLPPRLRDAFELPYGPSELRSVERVLTVFRNLHPWVPAGLRYVAPYHEALARLAGRNRPAPLTRVLNRFWIGQSSMAVGGD
ncbi:MAG: oxygenase MpaB family protein [Stellaceae bacterium]